MTKRKGVVAPTLRAIAAVAPSDFGVTTKEWAVAAKELQALLAVARAAAGVFDPEDRGEPALDHKWKRLDRALARLERAP